MRVDLKWSDFNSERMELQILQRWFCSVASPCIAEAIHWNQPWHKVEKLLIWKFGVSAFCLCKVILKTSSVTKLLQCLCCQLTIYHWFVDILLRYDLFWWLVLVPKKSRSACSFLGQNIDISLFSRFVESNVVQQWALLCWPCFLSELMWVVKYCGPNERFFECSSPGLTQPDCPISQCQQPATSLWACSPFFSLLKLDPQLPSKEAFDPSKISRNQLWFHSKHCTD